MFIVLLPSIVHASNHTKCVLLSNGKSEIQPTLINFHPKNCTTINLQLNLIEELEVVILLMTYLIKYVFQIKQKIKSEWVQPDHRNK